MASQQQKKAGTGESKAGKAGETVELSKEGQRAIATLFGDDEELENANAVVAAGQEQGKVNYSATVRVSKENEARRIAESKAALNRARQLAEQRRGFAELREQGKETREALQSQITSQGKVIQAQLDELLKAQVTQFKAVEAKLGRMQEAAQKAGLNTGRQLAGLQYNLLRITAENAKRKLEIDAKLNELATATTENAERIKEDIDALKQQNKDNMDELEKQLKENDEKLRANLKEAEKRTTEEIKAAEERTREQLTNLAKSMADFENTVKAAAEKDRLEREAQVKGFQAEIAKRDADRKREREEDKQQTKALQDAIKNIKDDVERRKLEEQLREKKAEDERKEQERKQEEEREAERAREMAEDAEEEDVYICWLCGGGCNGSQCKSSPDSVENKQEAARGANINKLVAQNRAWGKLTKDK